MFKISLDTLFRILAVLLVVAFVLLQTYHAGGDAVRAKLQSEYIQKLEIDSEKFKDKFSAYNEAVKSAQTKLNEHWQVKVDSLIVTHQAEIETARMVEGIKSETKTVVDNCIVSNHDLRLLNKTFAIIRRPIPSNSRTPEVETGNKPTPAGAVLQGFNGG